MHFFMIYFEVFNYVFFYGILGIFYLCIFYDIFFMIYFEVFIYEVFYDIFGIFYLCIFEFLFLKIEV